MKKIYIALFLIIVFLVGCTAKIQEENAKEEAVEKVTADISDVGEIGEELDVKTLDTLEDDLNYIETI